jgi:DNA polymerase-3 subunit alpha
MAKERENFGFYFRRASGGAVARGRLGQRRADLCQPDGKRCAGGRPGQAVMAAMVENVNRRKTRRGGDFIMADFSDSSGQFSASCFEESLVDPMLGWAKDGTCLLLQVELDSPSPKSRRGSPCAARGRWKRSKARPAWS